MCPIAASAASSQSVLRTVTPGDGLEARRADEVQRIRGHRHLHVGTGVRAGGRTSSTALYAAMPPQTP
jgi:hypothetical protein